jgi:hypothetical protein
MKSAENDGGECRRSKADEENEGSWLNEMKTEKKLSGSGVNGMAKTAWRKSSKERRNRSNWKRLKTGELA